MQPDKTAKMQFRAKIVRASILLSFRKEAKGENIAQEALWKESSMERRLARLDREKHPFLVRCER
ncbi:hypothetical protein [Sinorhizobium fredii]|nr:hypothetical protein [Sinorhizobium fredii]MCG5475206.1 hypothetical protein [Sinorhizobium fredii]WOS64677.1 hypothetical protein SFGR64A_00150 [Sinorhizobium fredii GR64]